MVVVDRADGERVTVPPASTPPAASAAVTLDRRRRASTASSPAPRRAAVALGRLLAAAEAAGGARECVDQASAYAKDRLQFGRVIAMFQAVKHHCANMLVAAELATAAVWDAGRAATGDPAHFELAAASRRGTLALPAFYRTRS